MRPTILSSLSQPPRFVCFGVPVLRMRIYRSVSRRVATLRSAVLGWAVRCVCLRLNEWNCFLKNKKQSNTRVFIIFLLGTFFFCNLKPVMWIYRKTQIWRLEYFTKRVWSIGFGSSKESVASCVFKLFFLNLSAPLWAIKNKIFIRPSRFPDLLRFFHASLFSWLVFVCVQVKAVDASNGSFNVKITVMSAYSAALRFSCVGSLVYLAAGYQGRPPDWPPENCCKML